MALAVRDSKHTVNAHGAIMIAGLLTLMGSFEFIIPSSEPYYRPIRIAIVLAYGVSGPFLLGAWLRVRGVYWTRLLSCPHCDRYPIPRPVLESHRDTLLDTGICRCCGGQIFDDFPPESTKTVEPTGTGRLLFAPLPNQTILLLG